MSQEFVLGVDLDGVCADYEDGFRRSVAELMEVDPSTIPPQTHWDFTESGWGIRDRDHFLDLHKRAVTDLRFFRSMKVMPGASEALWQLSNAGIWIRIVSHRLCVNGSHAAAASDTVEWLDEAKLPYRDLCLVADKPAVGCDLYVDDAPTQIAALRESGHSVIVFDQLYNQGLPGPRAYGWGDVAGMVLAAASRARGGSAAQLHRVPA